MLMSCPSRGTWIEILCFADVQVQRVHVVPLTGHVDRNIAIILPIARNNMSCPSRGTWIEMPCGPVGPVEPCIYAQH